MLHLFTLLGSGVGPPHASFINSLKARIEDHYVSYIFFKFFNVKYDQRT